MNDERSRNKYSDDKSLKLQQDITKELGKFTLYGLYWKLCAEDRLVLCLGL